MSSIDVLVLGMVPIIVAAIEMIKKVVPLKDAGTVIGSFVVGVVVALLKVPGTIPSWPQALLLGLYAGGLAAGLWKAAKNIAG